MTAELHADTGRPDSRELSRVVAVKLLTRSGVLTEKSLEFRPTGTVTRTPVDPGQLVSRVQAEGVPADVICNAKNVRSFIAANPAQAEAVGELAARAATMRMAWVDLQNDFIDDLAGVRQELDIADW